MVTPLQPSTRDLPFVLRREAFGGIVFDPFDGTMLQLDPEAYEVARKTLLGHGLFFSKQKREMMVALKQELKINRHRTAREVIPPDGITWEPDVPVPSLVAPTLVDFQITDKCNMGCPHCYASSVPEGKHVPWELVKRVVEQCGDCGVCQLAIGGGEPLLHPNIIDLLKLCHDCGIVPNLTTSGLSLTREKLQAIRRYCGAIGVSMEGVGERYTAVRGQKFESFIRTLDRFKDAGVPTVIQITLSRANFDELEEMVDFCLTRPELYGVTFLAYKPVGRGESYSQELSTIDPHKVSSGLSRAFRRIAPHMKVGYDCCMTPGVAGVEAELSFVDDSNVEGCSALRGSVGVDSSLEVIPCTFTWRHKIGNLKDNHLRDVWRNAQAETFRNRIHHKSTTNASCGACPKQSRCRGGCPVMPLINCHNDHTSDPDQEWVF